MNKVQTKVQFSRALLASCAMYALTPGAAMAAEGGSVIPKFPTAKSASALSKQVQDYDNHLHLAQTVSQKSMDLSFAKFDVEQDMKSAALAGDMAKAKTLQSKYEKMKAQEDGMNDTTIKQMTQALGLYQAIVASPLYAGRFATTTTALNPMAVSETLTDMGAAQLKFIKAK